jgi:hypothetical protein
MEDRSAYREGWWSYRELDGHDWLHAVIRHPTQVLGTSRSWAGAEPFAQYIEISGRARRCRRDELELGDVIQWRRVSDMHIYHTVIVTKVEPTDFVRIPAVFQDTPTDGSKVCRVAPAPVSTGQDIFISEHEHDRVNASLTELEKDYDPQSIVYWKINPFIPPSPYPRRRADLVRGYP